MQDAQIYYRYNVTQYARHFIYFNQEYVLNTVTSNDTIVPEDKITKFPYILNLSMSVFPLSHVMHSTVSYCTSYPKQLYRYLNKFCVWGRGCGCKEWRWSDLNKNVSKFGDQILYNIISWGKILSIFIFPTRVLEINLILKRQKRVQFLFLNIQYRYHHSLRQGGSQSIGPFRIINLDFYYFLILTKSASLLQPFKHHMFVRSNQYWPRSRLFLSRPISDPWTFNISFCVLGEIPFCLLSITRRFCWAEHKTQHMIINLPLHFFPIHPFITL